MPDESNDEIFDMSTILDANEVVQRRADPGFHLRSNSRFRVLNGRASSNQVWGIYNVKFMIVTCHQTLHLLESRPQRDAMICTGILSVAGMGLKGVFRYLNEGTGEYPFAIFTKKNNEDQIQVPCIALSEGSYEFNCSCFSTRTQPFESCAEVTLLPNGRLRGLVHEYRLQSDHPDTAIVKGSWKRDQICFAMTRKRDATTCSFTGKPCAISVRGAWQTKRLKPEELLLDSGEFDFRLLRCRKRVWCDALHPYYPVSFRKNSRWLLLLSLRTARAEIPTVAIPTTIWCHVLSYCAFNWFGETALEKIQQWSVESSKETYTKQTYVDFYGPIDWQTT